MPIPIRSANLDLDAQKVAPSDAELEVMLREETLITLSKMFLENVSSSVELAQKILNSLQVQIIQSRKLLLDQPFLKQHVMQIIVALEKDRAKDVAFAKEALGPVPTEVVQ